MKNIPDMISLWPSDADFERDVGAPQGYAYNLKQRNSLPDHYWRAAVKAATTRGIDGVTYEALARMAENRKPKAHLKTGS